MIRTSSGEHDPGRPVISDVNEELSIQYAMARRQYPLASAEKIAEVVLSRLSDEEQLVLAGDALLFNEESAGRRDLARHTVMAYVLEIESGYEDESG